MENAVSFNQLQESLTQVDTQNSDRINFNEGEYCLSLYADDNHFYRAKVLYLMIKYTCLIPNSLDSYNRFCTRFCRGFLRGLWTQ